MCDKPNRPDTPDKPHKAFEPMVMREKHWDAPVHWLYLGGDAVIDSREVVAILDGERGRRSAALTEYIQRNVEAGRAIDVSDGGSVKSVVITADRVYLSQVAPPTVGKRANIIYLGEGEGEE
jgi:regulator of extracellular matrix RemA (YlzA/DUF370 family)